MKSQGEMTSPDGYVKQDMSWAYLSLP